MTLLENDTQEVFSSSSIPGEAKGKSEKNLEDSSKKSRENSLDVSTENEVEEDEYDDLLDNLLSDEAESPESVKDDIENSSTFQRFWNSADSDDEECPTDDKPKLTDLDRDDRSVSFYSEQQNQNENEDALSRAKQFLKGGMSLNIPTNSKQSPRKSSIQSPVNKIVGATFGSSSNARSPLTVLKQQSIMYDCDEFAYDTTLPMQYNTRRVSTGSIPVPKSDTGYDPEEWKPRELPSKEDDEPMILSIDDILHSNSEDTESAGVSVSKSLATAASANPIASTSEHSSKENRKVDKDEGVQSVTGSSKPGTTEKTTDSKSATPEETSSNPQPTEDDPYEWAYTIWRRKGLMAGSPTSGSLRQSSSEEMEATALSQNPSFESTASSKRSGVPEMKQIRNPKDRRSLPAKIAAFETRTIRQQAKARNGVGFSLLLNKWKEKSDDNPNAHFLSPRELNTEKTKPVNSAEGATIDKSPLLSPSKRRQSLDPKVLPQSVKANNVAKSSTTEHTSRAKQPHQKTPSRDKNALSRYLQRTKPTPTKANSRRSLTGENRDNQCFSHITEPIDETKEMTNQEHATPVKKRNSLVVSPLPSTSRHDGGSRRSVSSRRSLPSCGSVSPSSTRRLFSPADDTLLEPREVMGRRLQSSERSLVSRNTTKSARTDRSHSAPFKEIFIIKDECDNAASNDDLKSVLSESICQQSVQSQNPSEVLPQQPSQAAKMHLKTSKAQITNLQEIMELKVDSMSFDSQSQTTHITFRTETLENLDKTVSKIATPSKPENVNVSRDLSNLETPSREHLIGEMGDMTGATPKYSERPWRKDLLVRNVTTAMEKARGNPLDCDCENSLAIFSENDDMVDFFLPLLAVTCSCRKSKQLVEPNDPTALENILRPWQISFLKAFGISKGDQLVKAHHRSSKSLAKSLYTWRQKNSMTTFRVGSCGMALQIWSSTCKAYVRSIRKQIKNGADPPERPNTLSVLTTFLEKMPAQMHRALPSRPLPRDIPDKMEEI